MQKQVPFSSPPFAWEILYKNLAEAKPPASAKIYLL